MKPNYTEENIAIYGKLFEDAENTIPLSLEGKQLRFDFYKTNSDMSFTIPDEHIIKIDNAYSFVIGKEVTSRYSGLFYMQISIIVNGTVVKSRPEGNHRESVTLTIKPSINVFNG